ncbi:MULTISPECIES: YjcZ family sporulation protein [Bacillus]|nr:MULTISPECIES: YjcZ family sporulation protein [Bacillus]
MHDYCYYTYGQCGYPTGVAGAHTGNTFVLIVVLFILLIIVGACYCK